MEAALAAEDPRLVSTLTAKAHTRGVAALIRGAALIAIGMVALLIGLAMKIPAVSFSGFIFALYGGFSAVTRGSARKFGSSSTSSAPGSSHKPGRSKKSGGFGDRLQRRWDERNN